MFTFPCEAGNTGSAIGKYFRLAYMFTEIIKTLPEKSYTLVTASLRAGSCSFIKNEMTQ